MSIAPTMHRLVLDLANGTPPHEGMLFHKQVAQLNLNYNEESLQKLDGLLTQLGKQSIQDPRYQTHELLKLEGGNTLFLSLCGFLGNYIARKISKTSAIKTAWHGDVSIVSKLKTEANVCQNLTSELIFMTGDTPNFPLQALFEKLTNAEDPEKSLLNYVSNILNNNGMSQTSITKQKTALTQQTAHNNTAHSEHKPYQTTEDVEVTPELLQLLHNDKEALKERVNSAKIDRPLFMSRNKRWILKGFASLFSDDEE